MDLATLIGLILGTLTVIAGIVVDSSIMVFINIPSVFIVVGGTIGAVLIKFSIKQFFSAFKVAFNALVVKEPPPHKLIDRAVELSTLVRKEGLLALENQDVSNRFFKKGLRLCADGLEPEFVRKVLVTEANMSVERHNNGESIFRAIGESAPAFGMIGTLIGLVQMLGKLDDPTAIGPAMAVALLTTLYGSVIANLLGLPIAEKLKVRSKQEIAHKELILAGMLSILAGENPRFMIDRLNATLPPDERIEEAA